MGYSPFESQDAMQVWLWEKSESSEPTFLKVHTHLPNRPAGMVSFLNITPEMRWDELGHIWYCPEVQRTNVNTEATYLMLSEAFDRLEYRRVGWKCDAQLLSSPSYDWTYGEGDYLAFCLSRLGHVS